MGSPVPQGTSNKNVQGGVLISIQNDATTMTDVGAHTERLFHHCAALRALLRGEGRSHGNDRDIVHGSIRLHPRDELSPSGIVNGRGQGGGCAPCSVSASLRRQSDREM